MKTYKEFISENNKQDDIFSIDILVFCTSCVNEGDYNNYESSL